MGSERLTTIDAVLITTDDDGRIRIDYLLHDVNTGEPLHMTMKGDLETDGKRPADD